MKPKTVLLVALDPLGCRALAAQVDGLIGDCVKVASADVKDPRLDEKLKVADVILLSGPTVLLRIGERIQDNGKVIVARRSIDYSKLSLLLDIPPGARVMLVSNDKINAEEVVDLLRNFGFTNFTLLPIHPGAIAPTDVDTAITPGDSDLVPSWVRQVIDIGIRTIDITTMTELLLRIGLLERRASVLSTRTVQHLITTTQQLNSSLRENARLRKILETTLDKVEEGILVIDHEGTVIALNRAAEELLKTRAENLIGDRLDEQVLALTTVNASTEDHQSGGTPTKLHGRDVFVSRIPLDGEEGDVIYIREFRNIQRHDKRLRNHLRQQGHVARYSFSDIVTRSQTMKDVLSRARTFSASDATVLIEGETGTGKELFAQAIHNASRRADRPFVAVNCAALPGDLLESELFGYAEGAFTGAKRGGRQGVFEQAHMGTIFLDEIADVPFQVQTRLLRVLEERKVMRVGGERISPIDVRVIAATNQGMYAQVQQGKFRSDLYYRLNVLRLSIPPLRERKEDLGALIDSFLAAYRGARRKAFAQQTMEILLAHHWPGNVREVRNLVEYLTHTVRTDIVLPKDLPSEILESSAPPASVGVFDLGPMDEQLLDLLWQAEMRGKRSGRRALAEALLEVGISVTEDIVRTHLVSLEGLGFVSIFAGRRGTQLTSVGRCRISTIRANRAKTQVV